MSDDQKFLLEVGISVLNLIVAAVGLMFVVLELKRSRKTTKGEFLLHLNEILNSFDDLAEYTYNTDWDPANVNNPDTINWARVNSYMGLFERIQVIIDDGILDFDLFMRLYGYRVRHLVNNNAIFEKKLLRDGKGWKDFVKLAKGVAIARKKDATPPTPSWVKYYDNIEKLTEKYPNL